MNPITFNDKFVRAIERHPHRALVEQSFGKWRVAPLFDYETTYDKEIALTPRGIGFDDLVSLPWPFETFRISITERDVPQDQNDPSQGSDVYKTEIVANRVDGRLHLMIFWRDFKGSPGEIMLHIQSNPSGDDAGEAAASLYSIRLGWAKEHNVSSGSVSTMAGSAVATFASFLEDAMLPTNQLVEVRPTRGNHSVHWQKARTHFTYITHGHPANKKEIAAGARVSADQSEELKRSAHNRREHKRTLRAARFTYARGKTITVRATWVGPREWMDEGGRQIYRILEPVV